MSDTSNLTLITHRVLKYLYVIFFYLLLFVSLLGGGVSCFGNEREPVKEKTMKSADHAWIAWKKRGNKVFVEAWFKSDRDRNQLFYELHALKKGASGQSETSQSGEFNAKAGKETILSFLVLSLSPGDSCILTLKVFGAQHEVTSEDEKIIKIPL
jgi:hypothetical protein